MSTNELPALHDMAERAHRRMLAQGFRTWLIVVLRRSMRDSILKHCSTGIRGKHKSITEPIAIPKLEGAIIQFFRNVGRIETRDAKPEKTEQKNTDKTEKLEPNWLHDAHRKHAPFQRSVSCSVVHAVKHALEFIQDHSPPDDWYKPSDLAPYDKQMKTEVRLLKEALERLRQELTWSSGLRNIAILMLRVAHEKAELRLQFDDHIGCFEKKGDTKPKRNLMQSFPPISRDQEVTLEQVKAFHLSSPPALDFPKDRQGFGGEAFFITDVPLYESFVCQRSADLAERLFHRLAALPESEMEPSDTWQKYIPDMGGTLNRVRREHTRSAKTRIVSSGPFVTAIYGPWGSGKTSMLRTIQNAFENGGTVRRPMEEANWSHQAQLVPNKGSLPQAAKYVCVHFAPWRYEREKHLIIPLVAEIASAIHNAILAGTVRRDGHLTERVAAMTKVLLACLEIGLLRGDVMMKAADLAQGVLGGASPAGFPNLSVSDTRSILAKIGESAHELYFGHTAFKTTHDSVEEQFRKTLRNLIRTTAEINEPATNQSEVRRLTPLAVFIDDLDRCDPTQVKRLLEAIKLYLNEPGIIHFLALDEEQVVRALGWDYKEAELDGDTAPRQTQINSFAKRYLEKFFQYAIDLGDGFSPIPNAIDDLAGECWFEFARISSGHASREFYEKTGITEPLRGKYPLTAGVDWFYPHRPFGHLPEGKATPPYQQPDELDQKLLEVRALAVYRIAHLFSVAKRNPRLIKQLARWLYLTMRRGTWADDRFRIERPILHERVRDFAEEVFSVNYGSVWVNEFHALREESRLAAYEAVYKLFDCCAMLAFAKLSAKIELSSDVFEKISSRASVEPLNVDEAFLVVTGFATLVIKGSAEYQKNRLHTDIEPDDIAFYFRSFLDAALQLRTKQSLTALDGPCNELIADMDKGLKDGKTLALTKSHANWVNSLQTETITAAKSFLFDGSPGAEALYSFRFPMLTREISKLSRLGESSALENMYIICRYAAEGGRALSRKLEIESIY